MRLDFYKVVLVALTSPSVATQQAYDSVVRRHQLGLPSPIRSAESQLQQQIIRTDDHKTELELDTLAELRKTLHTLQNTWFDLSKGTWPTSIDWTGAVLNTHLISSLDTISEHAQNHSVHDLNNYIDHYFAQTIAYYYGEDAASIRREAYDDMLWVVLSWLETIKFIRNHSLTFLDRDLLWFGDQFVPIFARRAKSFYNTTTYGWSDNLCGGGMTWNPSLEPYKNAITNELYITASVGMYLHFPDNHNASLDLLHRRQYLNAAINGYDWLVQSNMTNRQGLFVDGFHIHGWNKSGTGGTTCKDRNEMVYTYNQGVILSGIRGLWEATGNTTYLDRGYRIIRNTIAATGWSLKHERPSYNTSWHGLGRFGIMEDYCDANGTCGQDAHAFKSIYFHHLGLFCEPLPHRISQSGSELVVSDRLLMLHNRSCKTYTPWVLHNAHAALSTRDSRGRIGTWWAASKNITEPIRLPQRAIDYMGMPLKGKGTAQHSRARRQQTKTKKQSKGDLQKPIGRLDWNDRGRGRTVESHSGGVAVLRCLQKMLDVG